MSNEGEFPLSWFLRGPCSSLKRERRIRDCLFMSSIKREIRHFHVVACSDCNEMYRKTWCTCKVNVLLNKPIAFFPILVDVVVVVAKAPYCLGDKGKGHLILEASSAHSLSFPPHPPDRRLQSLLYIWHHFPGIAKVFQIWSEQAGYDWRISFLISANQKQKNILNE